MPCVSIEVRRQYTPEQEVGLIEAVHRALREAFKIPPGDRDVRVIAHEPHRFSCPPALARPDCYTLVAIDAFCGRSLDAKRDLYKAIVNNFEPFGIPKDHVKILLREVPRENWGIRGGKAAVDIELGFKIEV